MKLLSLLLTIALAFTASAARLETDLCIYGGTSAGVIAAVQASKMGKKVVLVEAGQHLGGMSVEGLGGTDIDNQPFQNSPAVGGLALEFYRRVSAAYGRTAAFEAMLAAKGKDTKLWRFEPHVAEAVWEAWVKEAGVTVLRGHRLKETNGVTKDGTRITALHFENEAEVRARVFIDATYEGDLLAFACSSPHVVVHLRAQELQQDVLTSRGCCPKELGELTLRQHHGLTKLIERDAQQLLDRHRHTHRVRSQHLHLGRVRWIHDSLQRGAPLAELLAAPTHLAGHLIPLGSEVED